MPIDWKVRPSVERSISKPSSLAELSDQARSIWPGETAVAVRPVGAVRITLLGAVDVGVGGVTVAVAIGASVPVGVELTVGVGEAVRVMAGVGVSVPVGVRVGVAARPWSKRYLRPAAELIIAFPSCATPGTISFTCRSYTDEPKKCPTKL